jgi:hypothetical protein
MRSTAGLQPGLVLRSSGSTSVYGAAPHAAGTLVELRSRCGVYHMVVAPEAVIPSTPHSDWMDQRLSSRRDVDPDRYRVRAGAPLTWADGSAAGVATGEIPVQGAGDAIAGLRCFHTVRGDFSPFSGGRDLPVAVLCVSPADLLLWPAHLPDAVTAEIHPDTRRYVTLEVTRRSGPPSAAIVAAVHASAKNALLVEPGWALGPPGQSAAAGASVAAQHGLAAFHVRVELDPSPSTSARKNPDGSEQGGREVTEARLVVLREPAGEEIGSTKTGLSSSLWLGQAPNEARLTQSALRHAWPTARHFMDPASAEPRWP